MRKGEQRSIMKTSGELGVTVDLWYETMGCWASARSEVLFSFIDECARCAEIHGLGGLSARAVRKGEQRSVMKTSGELGVTVDLWYGTMGCWASARSEVLFSFIDECARCAEIHGLGGLSARAMRKGEQRSVMTSGELGVTVDLWYGTLG